MVLIKWSYDNLSHFCRSRTSLRLNLRRMKHHLLCLKRRSFLSSRPKESEINLQVIPSCDIFLYRPFCILFLGIYRTFMKDMIKLRLKTTQSYLKSLQSGLTQGTDNSGVSLRLHASVTIIN